MKQHAARMVNGFITITLALWASGCSSVYSPVPIGEPVDLSAKLEKWEGTWIHDGDQKVTVRVVDARRGLLSVQNADDESDPELVHITKYKGWLFASMTDDDQKTDAGKYVWGRFLKDDRVAILWAPDAAKFIELVKATKSISPR